MKWTLIVVVFGAKPVQTDLVEDLEPSAGERGSRPGLEDQK
jgi:hypothetical protein